MRSPKVDDGADVAACNAGWGENWTVCERSCLEFS